MARQPASLIALSRWRVFAAEPDIINPVAFTIDERGRLWVVECFEYPSRTPKGKKPRDRIKILEDTDGDGKCDKVTVWAEGKDLPIGWDLATGIEVGHGGVENCLPAAEDEDEGTLFDEALCRREANAGSAARDDCNLTVKLSHDFSFRGVGTASASEILKMGPPASVVECGSAHIGGAKSIQSGRLTPAATIGVRRSELGRARR